MNATLKPIGHIKTPYQSIDDCPRNIDPSGPSCELVVADDFKDGLLGLEAGGKILILYWLEDTDRDVTLQESNTGGGMIGTFALRSPHRPNPIGAAVVEIEAIKQGRITVRGLDCLDGTKLIDIKPAILHEL